jgi:glutathione synthase/RimK-type ligase-like ATP-grasp enzyme
MLGIFREEIFSPNRVEDDSAILKLTADVLRRRGYRVSLRKPEDVSTTPAPTMTFAMCEGIRPLKILEKWSALGYPVHNNPTAVQNCYRWRMLSLLAGSKIPFPKSLVIHTHEQVNGQFNLHEGVWVKRGDVHSTQEGDVRLIYDRFALEKALDEFRARWIKRAVIQEHIIGDLIKFYGIRKRGWFRYFYHKPDQVTGYPFSPEEIRKTGELTATKLGLDIYGGDIVVTDKGHYLIDINSWPSFAVCRQEAAEEIASFLIEQYGEWEPQYGLRWGSL